MIESISLKNFRGFDEHYLPLLPMTVIVGENNAGKTSIVEALRLVSMITLRYRNFQFKYPPSNTDIPRAYLGISPSLKNYEINFNTIFHRYNGPPAVITTVFSGGYSLIVYVIEDEKIHAVIKDVDGKIVRDRIYARSIELPSVRIMPQIAPLQRQEKILSGDYVRAAMSSRLSPMHFRNQLKVNSDYFSQFKSLVEETWSGVQILELIGQDGLPGDDLYLEVRNNDFVAEVAEMGHGLQMWLQAMWFLTLSRNTCTVILDEPDVYLHADLQRRIIRLLKNKHPQTIVTTHSAEIMSEVQPEEILVVDKNRRLSEFAGSVPAVQSVLNTMGSIQNLHLARLVSAKKMIMVEGEDVKILKVFQNLLFPNSKTPLDAIPNMSIGGWSGWKYAVGGSMTFHNALGEDIKCYCVLDSDYHSRKEIEKRYEEARQRNVILHIWKKKEIENYLLIPEAICRFIIRKAIDQARIPARDDILMKINAIADELECDVFDAYSDHYYQNDRKKGVSGGNREARCVINAERESVGNIVDLVSGKQIMSRLSDWAKNEYGVSFSVLNIAREILVEEVLEEIAMVIEAIELCYNFADN